MEDFAEILALDAELKPQQERMLQIFSEACRLFAVRGFEGTSMKDIAAVCGISKATLYHYFADKDAIVRPLMLGTTRAIHDRVSARLDRSRPATEQLRVFMVESAACFERFRWPWIASASMFWNDPQERHRAERIAWRDRYEGLLRGILQDAMARGEIRTMNVSLAGRFVLSTLNWLPRWYDAEGPLTPPQIAEQFYDMVLQGFRAE